MFWEKLYFRLESEKLDFFEFFPAQKLKKFKSNFKSCLKIIQMRTILDQNLMLISDNKVGMARKLSLAQKNKIFRFWA